MTTLLAIDPGTSGGIVTRFPDGTVDARKMPATERDVWDSIREDNPDEVVLEYVRSSSQMGVTSAFSFGWNYGMLRAFAIASGARLIEVRPQDWQKRLSLPTVKQCGFTPTKDQRELAKKKTDAGRAEKKKLAAWRGRCVTEKKRRHKARAQELFPGVKVTNFTADALLIMEWAKVEVSGA